MKRNYRAAIGGMRNPASSLARVPSSCEAGDLIRPILDEIIADHESLRDPVRHILAGLPSTGFPAHLVAQARERFNLDKGEDPKGFTVASKLVLVRKVKPDGSTKYRLVWDFRRSGVNDTISQGERILVPSLLDDVRSARGLANGRSHLRIFFVGVDVF
jgi:hypothetical protein